MKSAHPEHWGFYKKLRRRMQELSQTDAAKQHPYLKYLMIAPDLFYLCIQLIKDPEVPLKYKARLAFTIAYFISPLDLLPEAIFGPFGYLDDIGLTAFVLNGLINEVPQYVLDRHWPGDKNVIIVIRSILLAADRMLGRGLWLRIKSLVQGEDSPERILKNTTTNNS